MLHPDFTAFRTGYYAGYEKHNGQLALTPPVLYAFYDDKTKGTIFPFSNPVTKTDAIPAGGVRGIRIIDWI